MALVGFVPEPNCGRGTVGILWNCLTTILLCSWTMIHNIDSESSKHYKIWSPVRMLLIPEGEACVALLRFVRSWRLRNAVRKHRGWDAFTLRQAFLVYMAGIRCTPSLELEDLPDLIPRYPNELGNALERFPTDSMIQGRSKSDTIAKAIATLQAANFAVTAAFRLGNHASLSLLEVLTAGYVLCGLIMGLVTLKWPQGFHEPFQVTLPVPGTTKLEPSAEWRLHRGRQTRTYNASFFDLPMACMTVLFTAVHLAAWNYPFPSHVEMVAWRVACLVDAVMGLLMLVFFRINERRKTLSKRFGNMGIDVVVVFSYMIARLFIIVESFIAFRAAPEEIYQRPSWAAYVGHIGS